MTLFSCIAEFGGEFYRVIRINSTRAVLRGQMLIMISCNHDKIMVDDRVLFVIRNIIGVRQL